MKSKNKEKKEWTSPYNEFNSIWCNSKGFREKSPATIPVEHLIKLADFYKEWGIKSTCVSGGGEPMINKGFAPFLYRLNKNGIKSGIISNGSLMDEKNAKAIVESSSWCGISVDAGSKEVFQKIKKIDMFDQVIKNIERLVKIKNKLNSKVEVTYKYLLHPWNVQDVYKAAKLAKSLGMNTFHLRPVCWDNLYAQKHNKSINFSDYTKKIESEIEKASTLEDENFKFFSVRHKFGKEFERKVNFKKCWATPLVATFGADGNVHLCFDVRGKKEWILCKHYPDPHEILKVWSSDYHKELINSINVDKCPRCTFGSYNETIEKAIIDDKMFLDFI